MFTLQESWQLPKYLKNISVVFFYLKNSNLVHKLEALSFASENTRWTC